MCHTPAAAHNEWMLGALTLKRVQGAQMQTAPSSNAPGWNLGGFGQKLYVRAACLFGGWLQPAVQQLVEINIGSCDAQFPASTHIGPAAVLGLNSFPDAPQLAQADPALLCCVDAAATRVTSPSTLAEELLSNHAALAPQVHSL